MKILITEHCVSCAHTELGGDTVGTADPRDIPDPVMLCSAVKIGEEAGRGATLGVCFPKSPFHMTEPLDTAEHLPAEGNRE